MSTRTQPVRSQHHIVILGGGFAGIHAVIELQKHFKEDNRVKITLISNENYFLFTPMLTEVVGGVIAPRHIVHPIRELCDKASFHRGEVQNIDLQNQTIDVLYATAPYDHEVIPYDQLVLAMGSVTNMKADSGAEAYAFDFKSIRDALKLRDHILDLLEQADTCQNPDIRKALLTFTVIGGGSTGVELASAMQSMLHRILPLYRTIDAHHVNIVILEADDRIIPRLPEDLSRYAQKTLTDRGLQIRLNTQVDKVDADSITLSSGEVIVSQTVIWTAGIKMPPLMRDIPAHQKDDKNRPLAASTLQLSGYANVWAIGDNIRIPLPDNQQGFYTATAQSAIQEGKHVAHNIYRIIHGEEPTVFRYESHGEMVLLGDQSAVAMIYGHPLKGFFAWIIWRCYYLGALPGFKKKVGVLGDWLMALFGPIETSQLQFQPRLTLKKAKDEKPLQAV